jgi:hypothetical protein
LLRNPSNARQKRTFRPNLGRLLISEPDPFGDVLCVLLSRQRKSTFLRSPRANRGKDRVRVAYRQIFSKAVRGSSHMAARFQSSASILTCAAVHRGSGRLCSACPRKMGAAGLRNQKIYWYVTGGERQDGGKCSTIGGAFQENPSSPYPSE